MNAPLRRAWTQQEFFAWAADQEGCHEFDGFQPVAMNGGTIAHGLITINLLRALDTRLRGSPCRVLGTNVALTTVGGAIRYPDALVTCTTLEMGARLAPDVVAVFEVLSPTTGRTDRIAKVREYAAVPSIRRYVILESRSVGLMVFDRTRAAESWRATTLSAGETLDMPEISASIPVAEFYEGVEPDPAS